MQRAHTLVIIRFLATSDIAKDVSPLSKSRLMNPLGVTDTISVCCAACAAKYTAIASDKRSQNSQETRRLTSCLALKAYSKRYEKNTTTSNAARSTANILSSFVTSSIVDGLVLLR